MSISSDSYAERVRRARAEADARLAEEERAFAPVRAEIAELLTMRPGPQLIARLDELAQQPIDQAGRLELAACYKRARSWLDAQEMAAVARAVGQPGREGYGWAVSDLAALTHTTEYAAGTQVTLMLQVSKGLPLCWEALNAGALSLAHVRAVAGPTERCSDELTQQVEANVVPKAIEEGWTPPQLRHETQRVVLLLDPDGARERAATAKKTRSDVRLYDDVDEMATLVATMDAWLGRQMQDTLRRRADELKRAGDPRSLGEIMVEVMAASILDGEVTRPDPTESDSSADTVARASAPVPSPARQRPQALVTVDLFTLLGLRNAAGELAGYGPITAELARRIASDAQLRLLVLGPTGQPISLGRRSYTPSAEMRRWIDARDRECLFPGCRRRAVYCQADHRCPYGQGGDTSCDNLGLLCQRHHTMKTEQGWRWFRRKDGSIVWVSVFGHMVRVKPRSYDATVPDDATDFAPWFDDPPQPDDVPADPFAAVDIPDPPPPPPVDDDDIDYDEWFTRFPAIAS